MTAVALDAWRGPRDAQQGAVGSQGVRQHGATIYSAALAISLMCDPGANTAVHPRAGRGRLLNPVAPRRCPHPCYQIETERHRLHRGQVSRTRYGTRATCGLQHTKHGCVQRRLSRMDRMARLARLMAMVTRAARATAVAMGTALSTRSPRRDASSAVQGVVAS